MIEGFTQKPFGFIGVQKREFFIPRVRYCSDIFFFPAEWVNLRISIYVLKWDVSVSVCMNSSHHHLL